MDPQDAPGPDNPFRQVIINTHSPYVVQRVDPQDLLFADTTLMPTPDGRLTPGLLLRPLADTWRAASHSGSVPVTKPDILPYLTTPPGAQLTLRTSSAESAAFRNRPTFSHGRRP